MINISEQEIAVLPEIAVAPSISADQAIAKASRYLAMYVSTLFGATDAVLLPLDRLTWQVLVYFKQPYMAPFKTAFLDIDAETGEVVTPYTEDEIETLLDRADAYAKLNPSPSIPGV